MLKSLFIVGLLALATPVLAAPPPRDMGRFRERMLDGHNLARAQVGVPPLAWDAALARDAERYAAVLADRERFEHSKAKGFGENLWMGTSGWFSYEQMLESWTNERFDYRHGAFPDVSPSGRAVGHYTQVVWRTTTHVGCGLAASGRNEYLVCRYSPPGNWIGKRAY